MMYGLIVQQIIGISNLSLPLIVVYYFAPNFLLSYTGILVCSLTTGMYVAFLAYLRSQNEMKSLTFKPSDAQAALFHETIKACRMDPEKIALRYAYADDGIAITLFNTIVIDPMHWKGIEDEEFHKTRDIIEKHVLPNVDEQKKRLHTKISAILTPAVQEFIFKHELGHVARNFSIRRITMVGSIATLSTSAALWAVWRTIEVVGGLNAFIVGFIVGFCVDLILSYCSNVLFKAQEEKKADLFACRFSSRGEIEAAADFFEQYEDCAQEYRNLLGGMHTMIPGIILTGYIDGASRALYLRAIAKGKKE